MAQKLHSTKNDVISRIYAEALKGQQVRMWFVVPGGLLIGFPTTDTSLQTETPETDNPNDLLTLKDAEFRMGKVVTKFEFSMVDLATVYAWGTYDSSKKESKQKSKKKKKSSSDVDSAE